MPFTEKYRKAFWTKPTLMVIFTITFCTLPWSIIDLFQVAEVPTRKFCLQTFSVLQLEKWTKIHSCRVGVSFIKKSLQLFWTLYVSFWNNTMKLSNFSYTIYANQRKRLALLYLETNSLHNTSKAIKNLATDGYIFLLVLSVTSSFGPRSKNFKLLVSKTL